MVFYLRRGPSTAALALRLWQLPWQPLEAGLLHCRRPDPRGLQGGLRSGTWPCNVHGHVKFMCQCRVYHAHVQAAPYLQPPSQHRVACCIWHLVNRAPSCMPWDSAHTRQSPECRLSVPGGHAAVLCLLNDPKVAIWGRIARSLERPARLGAQLMRVIVTEGA